jgi:hypothetical protein
MAANLIKLDKTKEIPRMATRGMLLVREGLETLGHARLAMIQARDGDGSLASHYDLLAAEGGYTAGDYADANAAAKASFDEVDSLYAKLSGNGSVTDVNAAILQCCAKHGV